MKLIAETPQEDRMIKGVTMLLQDLGLDATGHKTRDAAAAIFWSVRDLPAEIPPSEREAFLASIEEDLYLAMIIAGYETIEKHQMRRYSGHRTIKA